MLDKTLKKVNRIPKKGISIAEWVLFILICVVCYVFFCYQDILVTAGHAMEYLNGHITDFYSACHKADGTYGANYLPTTFIIFAIWNIPMKLLGQTPDFVGDWSLLFIMWNKILPTIAYFVCGYIVYKFVKDRMDFSNKKAMLTAFLFLTTPMAFFSQFFFCQYDIFTVMFMLIGMYYFFKPTVSRKDYAIFILSFGIATTFKYYALLIFVVLLLLKVKNVFKIIIAGVASVALTFAEILFYGITDRHAFVKSVFGFNALDKADGFTIDLGGVDLNLLYVVLLVIIAFAYFTQPKDYKEFAQYGLFYSCGICFALFSMMRWYPQWILFMAPFWILSTVINKNYKILFWIDTMLGVVINMYCINEYADTTDQYLFRYGILHDILVYKQNATFKMQDLFVIQNSDLFFTILGAIFLIGFVFKHPKFDLEKLNTEIEDIRLVVNVRYLLFTAMFILGAFVCLPNFLSRTDTVWARTGGKSQEIVTINNKTYADEYTKLEGKSIEAVYAVCDEYAAKGKKSQIIVDVYDTATGEIVATGSAKEKNIPDGKHKFTKINLDSPLEVDNDTLYQFRFYTNSSRKVAIFFEKDDGQDAKLFRTYQKDYSSTYSMYKGKVVKDKDVVMRLAGQIE